METKEKAQLTREGCRARQDRLRREMAGAGIDRAVVAAPEHVQWLTGFRPHVLMSAAAVLDLEGGCTLAAPNQEPAFHAADRVVTFDAQWQATLRQEQAQAIAAALGDALGRASGAVGAEDSRYGPCLARALGESGHDLEPILWRLRRIKGMDEIAMIRQAIACTEAMYGKAREIIAPGISELEVYSQLHAAAVAEAGEALTGLGNDFQCNSPGGPARSGVKARSGELYILDLGPAYRGYYADNCRAFAVDGRPSEAQLQAWETVLSVFPLVREMVRPGASCRELYARCKELLDAADPAGSFWHHLGHGIGLYPHEAPHLNPAWDDQFQEGEVFTVEPGLYREELKAGIRIEENYLVTAEGTELLTRAPLEL